jgi:hypothetical protein
MLRAGALALRLSRLDKMLAVVGFGVFAAHSGGEQRGYVVLFRLQLGLLRISAAGQSFLAPRLAVRPQPLGPVASTLSPASIRGAPGLRPTETE